MNVGSPSVPVYHIGGLLPSVGLKGCRVITPRIGLSKGTWGIRKSINKKTAHLDSTIINECSPIINQPKQIRPSNVLTSKHTSHLEQSQSSAFTTNPSFPLPAHQSFLYPTINHIYNPHSGKKETIDTLRTSAQHDRWEIALSNEWGLLAQGHSYGVLHTDTIDFIDFSSVPPDRDVTYATFVCDHRPLKSDPWRVRIVVGGDRLSYNDDPRSPAASLLETKILINSVMTHIKAPTSCHWT